MLPAVPVMVAVFLPILVIGTALPVLQLYVHDELGFGSLVMGLVAEAQFIASLLSRFCASWLTGTCGAKRGVVLGLLAAIAGGICYLASSTVSARPETSVAILIVGRRALLVGKKASSSLVACSGAGLVPADCGAGAMGWIGMAMYLAMAIGTPIGSFVFAR